MIELLILFLLGIILEIVDSSIGMGYGTILTPTLIFLGYSPIIIIPAVLFSQAIGGIIATISHHKNKNIELSRKSGKNELILIGIIAILGVIASIAAPILATQISKKILNTYIGLLVLLMGLLILSEIRLRFSFSKMIFVGIISSFNKGISGGGFGPVVTGSQIVLGQKHKKAVACTTASEPLICFAGFLSYLFITQSINWSMTLTLSAGAMIGALIGPVYTRKLNPKLLKRIIAVIMIMLAIITLLTTYNLISFKLPI